MGSQFVGALVDVYADDITLLTHCKSSLSILIAVCENYAAEYYNMFNWNKVSCYFLRADSLLWWHQ